MLIGLQKVLPALALLLLLRPRPKLALLAPGSAWEAWASGMTTDMHRQSSARISHVRHVRWGAHSLDTCQLLYGPIYFRVQVRACMQYQFVSLLLSNAS